MTKMTSTKDLTSEEKEAAEAAFQGLPPDTTWSAEAKAVYEGVMAALDRIRQTKQLSTSVVVSRASRIYGRRR